MARPRILIYFTRMRLRPLHSHNKLPPYSVCLTPPADPERSEADAKWARRIRLTVSIVVRLHGTFLDWAFTLRDPRWQLIILRYLEMRTDHERVAEVE